MLRSVWRVWQLLPPAAGEPGGMTTAYTYYPGGAAETTTTPAGTTTQSYNPDGTLASSSRSAPASGYSATAEVSYTYDSAGLVASRTDGTGTTSYTYDLAGDKTSADFVPAPGSALAGRETYYTYVSTGQLASMTYPQAPAGASPTVRYAYNSLGQMSSLTDWAANTISFGYDADANLTSVGYPNATATSASYDLADVMTATSAFAGTPSSPGALLAGVSYGVNAAEQVSSETDSGALAGTKSYTYDLADRLGSTTQGSAPAATAAYDASGDPTTLANGATQAFNADSQLSSTTAASGASETYTYNPTGDRTGATGTLSGSSSFAYDQADQLVSASTPTGGATYAYNGAGLLTGRSEGGATATFTWDSSTGLALLVDDGTNDYLYGPGGTPVEQAAIATGTPEYYFSDAQGSTRALIGANGALAASYTYDPYGNLSSSSGVPSLTQLRYDGQYADPASGSYYLRARWYDPATDQFSSVDPLVSQTAQPYEYTGDNPVYGSDPSGQEPVPGPPQVCNTYQGRVGFICIPTPVAFSSAVAAEDSVPLLYGANPNNGPALGDPFAGVRFHTPWGIRIPDGYNSNTGLGVEVKIGRPGLSRFVATQVNKDAYLLTNSCNGAISGNPFCQDVWSFWPSQNNNSPYPQGPSGPLVERLLAAHIQVSINYFLPVDPSAPDPAYSFNPNWGQILNVATSAGLGVVVGGIGWWILGDLAPALIAGPLGNSCS